ncbi:MAG: DNA polymerase III subunit gamma/tau [Elusimicrobiota bacterium]
MSYLVLARKYRPLNFDELVGQKHITDVLKNAIVSGRIAHAYLFSGPRGTGKTTAARILSKALNCLEGPTPSPCLKCINCGEIRDSNSVDVNEIDGASNRGIDEIRALRENIKFIPVSSKYKVYIIDEAHQITDFAFNALLKTLEEPPEHTIFILATTEPNEIPLTILSRCQRFKFVPLSVAEIASQVEKIVRVEKFSIDESAVKFIATVANGSLRDALSMLDQAVSFSPGETVTQETIRELLGMSPRQLIFSLVQLISSGDTAGVLNTVSDIAKQGYDFVQIAKDIMDYISHLILINSVDDIKVLQEACLPEEIESLRKQKGLFRMPMLLRNLHLVSKCIEEARRSDNQRIIFELYMLKMMSPSPDISELVERIDRVCMELRGGLSDDSPVEHPEVELHQKVEVRPKTETRPVRTGGAQSTAETSLITPAAKHPKPDGGAGYPENPPLQSDLDLLWQRVIADIEEKKISIGTIIKNSVDKKFVNGELVLFISPGLAHDTVKKNTAIVESSIKNFFGSDIKIRYETRDMKKNHNGEMATEFVDESVDEGTVQEAPASMDNGVSMNDGVSTHDDEVIKKIVGKFSGKIIENT